MSSGSTVTAIRPASDAPVTGGVTYPSHYSAADREMVERVATWIGAAQGRSIAQVARLANVVRTTLSMCLGGSYASSPTEHLTAACAAIAAVAERETMVVDIPYVAGSMHRMMGLSIARARQYRAVVILTGQVGTGKTRAARETARGLTDVTLIEAHGEMSTGAMLDEVCLALGLGVEVWRPAGTKMQAIIRQLRGSVHVIVVDEAETLAAPHRGAGGARSLETLRRIRDLADIGLVLIGTPALHDVIGRGQFDQLRSRTNLSPETVRGLPREDIEAVALAALADQGEAVTPDVLAALWAACGGREDAAGRVTSGGSMRVLVEGLLPGIRDFGLARGRALDAGLVRAVARQALGQEVR